MTAMFHNDAHVIRQQLLDPFIINHSTLENVVIGFKMELKTDSVHLIRADLHILLMNKHQTSQQFLQSLIIINLSS